MTDSYRVNLDELEDISTQLTGFVGFLTESIAGIRQRTSGLQSSWTGPSATAADEAFTKWVSGAQDVAEGIEAMRTAALAARDRYNSAVATNLRMLGRSTGSES
ncbi:WXG100 family type VII secretion target [Nocardia puris]|uniref:WXG100 family type VII secretion target n=1 Tax=Nocardia puris TaxID=208602 RepID=A0A366DW73_9NOCA|nr:WXG100 family type VII secretion target [Nocardia puris]RBO94336.1 WXG100 family type VII secretion target [Nocardia puris]